MDLPVALACKYLPIFTEFSYICHRQGRGAAQRASEELAIIIPAADVGGFLHRRVGNVP